jgi:hypothetical protein
MMIEVTEQESTQGTPELRLDGGRLLLLVEREWVPVRLRLCFPWSEPSRYVSLRNDEDDEIAFVESPGVLAPSSRHALHQALAEAGFVLDVVRMIEVREEVEIRNWVVETVQGRRTFQTHLDDWPRTLPSGGLLIRDVAGDLYRIAEPDALDPKSRQILWAFVD